MRIYHGELVTLTRLSIWIDEGGAESLLKIIRKTFFERGLGIVDPEIPITAPFIDMFLAFENGAFNAELVGVTGDQVILEIRRASTGLHF